MNEKVILPTPTRISYERDKNTRRKYEVYKYGKYEFSIEEALKYMIDNGREYMFDNMILHNVNMRNQMRTIGAEALVDQLRQMVKPNSNLENEMQRFVNVWGNKALGDIDIQVRPIGMRFEVDGLEFDGLKDLNSAVDRMYLYKIGDVSQTYNIPSETTPRCHVAMVWETYPTFDVYDCSDNRSYNNYLIRRRPVSDAELIEVGRYGHFDFCAITEDTTTHLLPMVYYVGDGGFMLVAEKHV